MVSGEVELVIGVRIMLVLKRMYVVMGGLVGGFLAMADICDGSSH